MAIESYEDDYLFPLPDEAQTSPIRQPKLKRLKKSSIPSPTPPVRVSGDGPVVSASDEGFEYLEEVKMERKSAKKRLSMEEGEEEILKKKSKKKSNSDDRNRKSKVSLPTPPIRVSGDNSTAPISDSKLDLSDDGLDPLFSVPAADEGFETLDRGKGEEEISKSKKKKKKSNPDKLDRKSKESAREMKRIEKERQARLEQIHAESQRLLRETRDVSFKPVPLVQKPISSVLGKIRLRKLEILKRRGIVCQSDYVMEADCTMDEIDQNSDPTKSNIEEKADDVDAKVEDPVSVEGIESNGVPLGPSAAVPCNNDVGMRSESTDGSDELNDLENRPEPNLNHDSDDDSSSEEDDDKENNDPHNSCAVNLVPSPTNGLAKVFLDDEAEEEDDSDHDLTRFQENEEDDESDDNDLDDLIATDYKEAPTDNEKRNELHQKWLEQQDAAGTDNLLQRLHCGQRQKQPTILDDDNDDDEEFTEEESDEVSHDLPVTSVVRQNAKKAKQMMAQMFTDVDDMYVPSDDEESEQTLIRQRVLQESGESSFISPIEDEHSREVFGLIKKLNIAPTTKRRRIATSSFDMLVGNSNSSSKTSFLNRTSSNSLPSLHKQGSTSTRAFIFRRDDSNSRSSIQASDKTPETVPKESLPSRAATSTKIRSSSQFKSTVSNSTDANSSSDSLFQILRRSSMQFDRDLKNGKGISSHEVRESQAAYQFSAFKLRTRK